MLYEERSSWLSEKAAIQKSPEVGLVTSVYVNILLLAAFYAGEMGVLEGVRRLVPVFSLVCLWFYNQTTPIFLPRK